MMDIREAAQRTSARTPAFDGDVGKQLSVVVTDLSDEDVKSSGALKDDFLLVQDAAGLVTDLLVDGQEVGDKVTGRFPNHSRRVVVSVAPIVAAFLDPVVVIVVLGCNRTPSHGAPILLRLWYQGDAVRFGQG